MAKRKALNSWEAIFSAFDKADKSLAMREADIQFALVSALEKWKADGNVQNMLSLVNRIPTMQAKGIRKNALIAWTEEVCKFKYDTKSKTFDKNKNTKYDGATVDVVKWWDCSPEPEFKPIDEVKAIEALITRLTKRIQDGVREGDVVHMTTVTKLREVVEEVKKAA